ncbi:MAG: SemiSWEET family sugar transporter [Candidatus Nitrosotenuis sp.]
MIEEVWVSMLGSIAAALVTASFIPQVIRGYRTKQLEDVSYWLMITICIGLSLWIVYGVIKEDLVIIGANISTIALNVILLSLKAKYSK